MVFTRNGIKAKPPLHSARLPAWWFIKGALGVIQFIKGDWPNGERNLLEPPGVAFKVMATGFTGDTPGRTADTAACQAVWQQSKRMLQVTSQDLLVPDELTYRVSYDCPGTTKKERITPADDRHKKTAR